jgi:integrase
MTKGKGRRTAKKTGAWNAGFRLPQAEFDAGVAAQNAMIKQLALDTSKGRVITGQNKRDAGGNDTARASTIARYETIWHITMQFLIMIGDIKSSIIFNRALVVNNPPAPELNNLLYCAQFMCMEEGSIIMQYENPSLPVLDAKGNPLQVKKTYWKGNSVIGLFQSACNKLFSKFDSTDPQLVYSEACPDCAALSDAEKRKRYTCNQHIGQRPRYFRQGNPAQTPRFKQEISKLKNYVKGHYKASKTFPLLPGQLRDAMEMLLADNNLYSFMLWVMMLVGTKMMLRCDELLALRVEDFKEKMTQIPVPNEIDGIVAGVQGKRDPQEVLLALWDDKNCPEFSATRIVLLWLGLSKIEKGYLFPGPDWFERDGSRLKPGKPVVELADVHEYELLLSKVKDIIVHVCQLTEEEAKEMCLIIGSHTFRRTAVLMAYWSLYSTTGRRRQEALSVASVCNAMRHKDGESTRTYLGDSDTLKTLLDNMGGHNPILLERHRVGDWKGIAIDVVFHWSTINDMSKRNQRPLPQLAQYYLREVLQVHDDTRLSLREIHERATKYVRPETKMEEKMKQLKARVDPEAFEWIEEVVQLAGQKRAREEAGPAPSMTDGMATPASKKAKTGSISVSKLSKDYQGLVANREAKKLTREEIVSLCVEATEEAKKCIINEEGKSIGKLVDPLKTFIYSRAAKVAQCVRVHHEGNVESFVEANPSFVVSRFGKCSKCEGEEKHTGHLF